MGWVVEWTSGAWEDVGRRSIAEQTEIAGSVQRFAERGDGCEVVDAESDNEKVLVIGRFEVLILVAPGETSIDDDGDELIRDVIYVLAFGIRQSPSRPSLRLV